MSRQIVVDDTDPGITYSGLWFPDRGSALDGLGANGVPYLHTFHRTTQNTSLTYTFQGTAISLFGSQQYDTTSAVSVASIPSWECSVDGSILGSTPGVAGSSFSTTYAHNNVEFCSVDKLTDATHAITLKVNVPDNSTFWFDYIRYQPSASVALDQAAILISSQDPQMNFIGWSGDSTNGYMASTEGASFTFDFIGISLSWYGSYLSRFASVPTTGIYTIDGGMPTLFNLNGLGSTSFYQNFFTTPTLPAGPHTLTVTYHGNKTTTPLTLDYLIVQNGTSSATVSSSGPSASSSQGSSPPDNTPTQSKVPVGAVVGGTVASAIIVITAAILLFLLIHRRKVQKEIVDGLGANNPRAIRPYNLDGRGNMFYTFLNPLMGNPVVGKHNADAMASLQPSTLQLPGAPGTDMNKSQMRRHDIPPTSIPPTAAGFTRVRNVFRTRGIATSAGQRGVPHLTVTRDEDSGIRLRQPDGGELLVLPPMYTPS